MIKPIQIIVISYNNLWILLKIINKNEMKHIIIYGTIKKIFQESSKYINKTSSEYTVKYSQEQEQQQRPMDHNENQQYFYKRKYDADDEDEDKLLDKENTHDNYIKIYNGDNSKNKKNNYNNVENNEDYNDDVNIEIEAKNCSTKFIENNPNISTRPCVDVSQRNQAIFSTYNYQNESNLEPVNKIRETSNNAEREDDQDTIDDGDVVDDDDEEHDKDESRASNDIEETSKFIRDEYTNVERQNSCKPSSDGVTVQNGDQKSGKDNDNNNPNRDTEISASQNLSPLSSYVQTQTIATTHVQNLTQHLDHQHPLVDANNLGQQISHGLHKSLHNLLEATGVKCVDSMGTLCDMEAFSKIDCKDAQNNQDYGPKKYYHPLYAHGVCRWPGCELPLEDMATFVKRRIQDQMEEFKREIRKGKKKQEQPSGSGVYSQEWEFYAAMSFLNESVQPRRMRANSTKEGNMLFENFLAQDDICDLVTDHEITPAKKPRTEFDKLCESISETVAKINTSIIEQPEESVDGYFLKTMMSLMKDLPPTVKNKFQSDIFASI